MSFLPLLVISVVILHIGNFLETENISTDDMKSRAVKYALPVAWTSVVFGIWGISDVYSGGQYEVPLLLILAHMGLRV
jgi:hypothetical protein